VVDLAGHLFANLALTQTSLPRDQLFRRLRQLSIAVVELRLACVEFPFARQDPFGRQLTVAQRLLSLIELPERSRQPTAALVELGRQPLGLCPLVLGRLLDPRDPRSTALRRADVARAMGELRLGLRDLGRTSAELLLEDALAVRLRVEREATLLELALACLDLRQSWLNRLRLALDPQPVPLELVGSRFELRRAPLEPVREHTVEPLAIVQVRRPLVDLALALFDVAH
jgi:hypothetical protein